MKPPSDHLIRQTIDQLLGARAQAATICPSEVARALAPSPQWRDLMDDVRRVAAGEQAEGKLEIRQGGKPVDPEAAKGPIRLGRPNRGQAAATQNGPDDPGAMPGPSSP